MNTRIYKVEGPNLSRLVRAVSRAQAIKFVTRGTYTAESASQEDIVHALSTGGAVEDATKEQES